MLKRLTVWLLLAISILSACAPNATATSIPFTPSPPPSRMTATATDITSSITPTLPAPVPSVLPSPVSQEPPGSMITIEGEKTNCDLWETWVKMELITDFADFWSGEQAIEVWIGADAPNLPLAVPSGARVLAATSTTIWLHLKDASQWRLALTQHGWQNIAKMLWRSPSGHLVTIYLYSHEAVLFLHSSGLETPSRAISSSLRKTLEGLTIAPFAVDAMSPPDFTQAYSDKPFASHWWIASAGDKINTAIAPLQQSLQTQGWNVVQSGQTSMVRWQRWEHRQYPHEILDLFAGRLTAKGPLWLVHAALIPREVLAWPSELPLFSASAPPIHLQGHLDCASFRAFGEALLIAQGEQVLHLGSLRPAWHVHLPPGAKVIAASGVSPSEADSTDVSSNITLFLTFDAPLASVETRLQQWLKERGSNIQPRSRREGLWFVEPLYHNTTRLISCPSQGEAGETFSLWEENQRTLGIMRPAGGFCNADGPCGETFVMSDDLAYMNTLPSSMQVYGFQSVMPWDNQIGVASFYLATDRSHLLAWIRAYRQKATSQGIDSRLSGAHIFTLTASWETIWFVPVRENLYLVESFVSP